MLGFFRPKNPRKKSVLSKQRVKPAGKTAGTSGHAWSVAAKCLLVVFLMALTWAIGQRLVNKVTEISSYLTSTLILPAKEWRVEVLNSDGNHLPDDIKREVYRVALKNLKTGSPTELKLIAKQVESVGSLESVRVVRPLIDTIILSAELRRPTLLIEVGGRLRFLTAEGTVFGDANDNTSQATFARPSVRVTGVFDQRPNPSMDSSNRLITNTDEKRHLKEILEIWRLVNESSIPITAINFQQFRGYALTLNDDTEIIIGLKPFAYKLKKLGDILAGLARDGIVASRIELDYEGKAFIKERTF